MLPCGGLSSKTLNWLEPLPLMRIAHDSVRGGFHRRLVLDEIGFPVGRGRVIPLVTS